MRSVTQFFENHPIAFSGMSAPAGKFARLVVVSALFPLRPSSSFFLPSNDIRMNLLTTSRRKVLVASSLLSGVFGGGGGPAHPKTTLPGAKGLTNEVTKTVKGMKHRRLGGSDITVSELGLGTQRWVSADYNAPNEETCFAFLDRAILRNGVNLIDTAEQYPIPSDGASAVEGDSERCIGKWIKERKVPRGDLVIATKITGGRNITPKNIKASCEDSLKRLRTDYVDVYQLHWPQRYSPQSNWGQSLAYDIDNDASPYCVLWVGLPRLKNCASRWKG